MAWFKVDDGFYSSRKVLSIPRSRRFEALGLWTTCGAWSSKELTDGFVPREIVEEFGGKQSQINDLISAKLWVEVDGGWKFWDWMDYQPAKVEVIEKREKTTKKRSAAGKKGAEARWQNHGKTMAKKSLPLANGDFAIDETKADDNDDLPENGKMANSWQKNGKDIAPTRPDPLTIDKSIVAGNGKNRAHALPSDWSPKESHTAFASDNGLSIASEADAFKNHAEATGRKMKNWDASFNLWLRNAVKWSPKSTKLKQAEVDWMNQ
jgi:hypothetical protein